MKNFLSSPTWGSRALVPLLAVAWLAAPHGAVAQSQPAAGVPPAAQAAFDTVVSALGATDPHVQAAIDLGDILNGKTEWTADLLNQIVTMANQAGVAFDELVPSVQGCIKTPDGTPLEAVPVVAMPGTLAMGALGFTPIAGITSGQATPATFGVIPVLVNVYLSKEQKARWGPGCYWMPFPISTVQLMAEAVAPLAVATGGPPTEFRDIRVIPITPGYHLDHAALGVSFMSGTPDIKSFDSPLQGWFDGHPYTPQ